jgi:hypothetical protein
MDSSGSYIKKKNQNQKSQRVENHHPISDTNVSGRDAGVSLFLTGRIRVRDVPLSMPGLSHSGDLTASKIKPLILKIQVHVGLSTLGSS